MAETALYSTDIRALPLHYRGKVRDIYTIDPQHWLIVATDRLSAFDVILPTPIPGKGKLLTAMALCAFNRFQARVPNHLSTMTLEDVLHDPADRDQAEGRSMIVKRLKAMPIEAVVRGYLAGSGWQEYQERGEVCGIRLPAGLTPGARLPEPIFTPATKAALGEHDENIDFARCAALVGTEIAEQVRTISLALYKDAHTHAAEQGLILADTKFEFGLDEHGVVTIMDEMLTPDSSRFWEASDWQSGHPLRSFDKQFVRDWLASLSWDRSPPGPEIPPEVVEGTLARYSEACARLCGQDAMSGESVTN